MSNVGVGLVGSDQYGSWVGKDLFNVGVGWMGSEQYACELGGI